ncbi:benzil reductase ((S)-benzoin forming) [Paenibacillus taihuensis]|uniref:Benzil reductase ((S)-benzoin forming) n=1 Tax=Paenibacillus taihuensis TaxID=1156355 RepID=A0A3D9SPN5_9BACL|nr:SDR family NAD(P)-dependent oxidoreductase [Paenibacillus taihuensis]REE94524.1 benzil reductase ((S)-benzoin forming) [Paenibacillus taihuensis]
MMKEKVSCNKAAIVTGTSRGLGEAIAEELILQGYQVFGMARTAPDERLARVDAFAFVQCDLADTGALEASFDYISRSVDISQVEELLLINNAAMLEPLRPLPEIAAAEMAKHLETSLLAPMVLCSRFIKLVQVQEQHSCRATIVNVTSGLGEYAAPSMSMYCSSKAAINMLTRCIAEEQGDAARPVQAYAYDPGMIDTAMQTAARGQELGQFPLQRFFQESYETGKLRQASDVALELLRMLQEPHENGSLLKATRY